MVGTLLAGDVKTINLLCWSFTRPAFTVKPEPPDDPCLTCGEPQKLSEDDCKKVTDTNAIPSPILSAYRVPVTVRERTEALCGVPAVNLLRGSGADRTPVL